MSVKCLPPQTPLLYSKNGVCRGIPIFLIFALKHRLWVLVRTASAVIFYIFKNLYILHGHVFITVKKFPCYPRAFKIDNVISWTRSSMDHEFYQLCRA